LCTDEFWIIFGFAMMGYKIGFEASGRWIGWNWERWMFEHVPTWVVWLSITCRRNSEHKCMGINQNDLQQHWLYYHWTLKMMPYHWHTGFLMSFPTPPNIYQGIIFMLVHIATNNNKLNQFSFAWILIASWATEFNLVMNKFRHHEVNCFCIFLNHPFVVLVTLWFITINSMNLIIPKPVSSLEGAV
jgi:hypothetical protein